MKITDINEYKMQRDGANMFMNCANCEHTHSWAVVCNSGGDAPVIVALLCENCQQELPVLYGKVYEPGDRQS